MWIVCLDPLQCTDSNIVLSKLHKNSTMMQGNFQYYPLKNIIHKNGNIQRKWGNIYELIINAYIIFHKF